jgi:predicted TIM-barrel fold metal-dependent hydrolase
MRAIDVHVHPSTRGLDTHACNYFRRDLTEVPQTAEGFADLYLQHDVKALLIGWHPSTVKEGARNSNEHAMDLATQYPKSFAGVLASLDTHAHDLLAVARYAEELVRDPKVVGFKFHPPDQGFYPSDITTSGKFFRPAGNRQCFTSDSPCSVPTPKAGAASVSITAVRYISIRSLKIFRA